MVVPTLVVGGDVDGIDVPGTDRPMPVSVPVSSSGDESTMDPANSPASSGANSTVTAQASSRSTERPLQLSATMTNAAPSTVTSPTSTVSSPWLTMRIVRASRSATTTDPKSVLDGCSSRSGSSTAARATAGRTSAVAVKELNARTRVPGTTRHVRREGPHEFTIVASSA